MITVTLNRTEFEYDIHSLIKAFFPKEDVELYYTKEAHADEKNVACTNHSVEQEEAGSSHFLIDYADDRISIAWDDAPDGPARRTFAVDFSNRTETKNALKEHLYRLLEEETGQPLPWGTLTGIRPTKIPMQMLDAGKTKEEIAGFLKEMELDDVAGKPVSEYSGGMKRRVAIARALLAEYDIFGMGQVKVIIQRMNRNVFKQPEELMENIVNVTEFLKKKIENFSCEVTIWNLRSGF